ncbi:MAG: NADH-quinone oxidoreductase subunit C [Thaumarchaeota archaeon]|nr:NADH-quinone oxidoreductase subunit C [Nitrososphaerota archaeon]
MSTEETKPEAKPVAAPEATPPAPAAKPATPPAPVKELPQFEKSIADKLSDKFGTKVAVEFVKPLRIRVKVPKEDVLDVAKFIRDELHFDHAESVTGVDYPDAKEIEVVYHLGSYTDPELAKQVLTLATRAPREENPNPGSDNTKLPSLRDIFYSVEFHERECFEMLGVYFTGHPDNRRLLLPEDWADLPPMRKDFHIKGR